MKKPIIAISLDTMSEAAGSEYSSFPRYALRVGYSKAVSLNGGIPIMLPFDKESIDDVLNLVDGLIIPGGNDIDPAFYGEEITSDTVVINHERTAYDMALLEKALEKKIPFLGICYGMQLLNVFLGGSLIQDIPGHAQPHPKNAPFHPVTIEPGTILAKIAANNLSWEVNSTHHQAVKAVGKDLVVSAFAQDGIIEAIEHTKDDFTIGVEWHPEYQECELDRNIYAAFIEAAKRYRDRRE